MTIERFHLSDGSCILLDAEERIVLVLLGAGADTTLAEARGIGSEESSQLIGAIEARARKLFLDGAQGTSRAFAVLPLTRLAEDVLSAKLRHLRGGRLADTYDRSTAEKQSNLSNGR